MKRHGQLWEQVISFEALLCAADEGRRGKRFRPAVVEVLAGNESKPANGIGACRNNSIKRREVRLPTESDRNVSPGQNLTIAIGDASGEILPSSCSSQLLALLTAP